MNITIEFTSNNTYMFAGIAIYGYSDHKTDITIEFTSKKLIQNIWIIPATIYGGMRS